MEQTLFVYKEVDLYKIPPRAGAGGHRSGDWRVTDKIFTARCKVVAQGENLEVRLEDPSSGELFGVCPIPRGQLHLVVESATDSSRNFVLRLEDATTKRHAFIGMNFADRAAAFDFNVALSDHEKQLQRDVEIAKITSSADPLAAAQQIMPEAASMYIHQDLRLKEGETIRIAVKKPSSSSAESGSSSSSGFLSRMGNLPQPLSAGSGAPKLMTLAPPPADLSAGTRAASHSGSALAAPVATARLPADPFASMPAASGISSGAGRSAPVQQGPAFDLLGLDNFAPSSSGGNSARAPTVQSSVAAFDDFHPFTAPAQPPPQSTNAALQPAPEPGWATFE